MDKRIGQITAKGVQWPKQSITGRKDYNKPPIGIVNIGNNRFVVLDVQPTDDIRAEIEALRAGLSKPQADTLPDKKPADTSYRGKKGAADAVD